MTVLLVTYLLSTVSETPSAPVGGASLTMAVAILLIIALCLCTSGLAGLAYALTKEDTDNHG
jgi:hypothetical protein